jgi:hypothetical protein
MQCTDKTFGFLEISQIPYLVGRNSYTAVTAPLPFSRTSFEYSILVDKPNHCRAYSSLRAQYLLLSPIQISENHILAGRIPGGSRFSFRDAITSSLIPSPKRELSPCHTCAQTPWPARLKHRGQLPFPACGPYRSTVSPFLAPKFTHNA